MLSKKALIGGVLLVLVAFAGLQLATYVTREGSLLEQTTISTTKNTIPVFLKAEEDVALKKQEPGNAQGSTVNTSDWTTKSNEHFKVRYHKDFCLSQNLERSSPEKREFRYLGAVLIGAESGRKLRIFRLDISNEYTLV